MACKLMSTSYRSLLPRLHTRPLSNASSTAMRWLPRRALLLVAGGTVASLAVSATLRARYQTSRCQSVQCLTASDEGARGEGIHGGSSLPTVTLYQYQSCPFCNKTRAFLDFYGLAYETVEVHPVLKREIRFSSYKMVPFVIVDGVQVNDSSLLISVLRSSMLRRMNVATVLDFYPEITFTDAKGKEQLERANKYFLMYGEAATERSLAELREEREWRQWVDDTLVHTIPPNIYRTLPEAVQAFDYISHVSKFSWPERMVAKYIGAVSMYLVSKSLKKKYHLRPEVRESLYECCNRWTKAVGKHRTFMGGDKPNLADLAVYGVLHSMEGLDSFSDVMTHTRVKRWYTAVHRQVLRHAGAT